ncbi:MAG TPA: lipid-A-disaccharide synthase [Cyclobacteriaceae bacterium]|nr:lipid-A-disaccharide synthase [Cyclobacteriaceae bacterium]
MRYYIIAGERSGDLHGGNLVKALKKHEEHGIFRGFGGEYMKEAGVDVVVHYSDMAFMGFIEVVKNLNTITRYIKQCKQDILNFKPDVIILIDYGGFNMRIAKFAKQQGFKVFYYIPPKVWAWNQKRALKIKATVDQVFAILPFEKDFFKKFDVHADYVGNPVLDAIKAHVVDKDFIRRNEIPTAKPIVALLPGSRKQELQRVIPVMTEVARANQSYQFVVAAVKNLDESLYGTLVFLPNVKFVYEETYDLLSCAKAAIVTSGTATLETALFKVPQIVVYSTSVTTYWIVKMMIMVPFISLVNLVAGKEVVKELIQGDFTVPKISAELNKLLNDNSYRETVLNGYDEIIKVLDTGSASENTARLMMDYLKK